MNVAIDFETTKLPNSFPWMPDAYAVCMSACDDDMDRRTWFFNHSDRPDKTQRESVQDIVRFLTKYDRVIAHNMKFELHWCKALGISLENHLLWDTMVVEYLIRKHGNLQELSLDELSEYYGLPPKLDRVKQY